MDEKTRKIIIAYLAFILIGITVGFIVSVIGGNPSSGFADEPEAAAAADETAGESPDKK